MAKRTTTAPVTEEAESTGAKRTVRKATRASVSSTPKATPERRPRARSKSASSEDTARVQALLAAGFALEKKATDVKLLELKAITSMTDYFIVASGDSEPQVKAIAENVVAKLRDEHGLRAWRSEGWDSLRWVLVDYVDFVVHVFQPEARHYYNLEKLWSDAPVTPIEDSPVKRKTSTRKKSVASDETTPTRTRKKSASTKSGKSVIRVLKDFDPVAGRED